MLSLLAQMEQPSGLQMWIERLARSSVMSVLLFCAVCTVISIGLRMYTSNPVSAGTTVSRIARFFQEVADSLVYAGILVFFLIRPFLIQTFIIPSESMLDTLKVGDVIIVDKLTYRLRDPRAGDIVVFKPPDVARNSTTPPGTDYVKRCIGTPGQLIELKDRQLFRDGKMVEEIYRKCQTEANVQKQINDIRQSNFARAMRELPGESFHDIIDFKLVNDKGVITPLFRDADGSTNPDSPFYVSEDEAMRLWALPAAKVPDGMYLMIGDNRLQSFDGRFWGLVPRRQIVGRGWWRILPFGRFSNADTRKN